MAWFTEKDREGFEEAMSWYDPLNIYYFSQEPSLEKAAKSALLPTMYFGAGYATSAFLSPGGIPYSPMVNTLHRIDQFGRNVKWAGRHSRTVGLGLWRWRNVLGVTAMFLTVAHTFNPRSIDEGSSLLAIAGDWMIGQLLPELSGFTFGPENA